MGNIIFSLHNNLFLSLITLVIIVLIINVFVYSLKKNKGNHLVKAICVIKSDDSSIHGIIYFNELGHNITRINGDIYGLTQGDHGLHIHATGDISNGSLSVGNHYNPHSHIHSSRTIKNIYGNIIVNKKRHVGDLGNITADSHGHAHFSFTDDLVRLRGVFAVIGRAVVVSELPDDFDIKSSVESVKYGNTGKRLAYGLIGLKHKYH